ncbi:DUF6990 domain-containing protein [Pandoraea fibrosis]|uniref:Uncharacterized protein n=1 Tax=Pandoraea fibrosis TaxID=1891094 RepID=A0A5E4Z2L9_9BURK|nr:hypothetical protein [Pandoraea fibrosis]VVE54570.1 hypothetical protein PFI31113_04910 [Pandoraea fibrosis]
MKESTAIGFLVNSGWRKIGDKVDDIILEFHTADRIITVIPSIRKLSNYYSISLSPSLTTEQFSCAARRIINDESFRSPLTYMKSTIHKKNEIYESTITKIIEEVIEWSQSIELKREINRHAQSPTDSKGTMPVRHLAALALLGGTERLEMYRTSFESGNRLGFVPYISIEMIERALEIAKRQ